MDKNKQGEWVITNITELFGWEVIYVEKREEDDDNYATITVIHKTTQEERRAKIHIVDIPVYSMEMKLKRR